MTHDTVPSPPPDEMNDESSMRGHVLVVEDDRTLARTYARTLRTLGYRVDVLTDGATAAQAVCEQTYDVVLSDVGLPHMLGTELLEFVRSHDPDLPVILVSGTAYAETGRRALDQGAFRFFPKPTNMRELDTSLHEGIESGRRARARRALSGLRR